MAAVVQHSPRSAPPSLPSVKCSTCARLVPLSELGAHVCSAEPRRPSPSPGLSPPPHDHMRHHNLSPRPMPSRPVITPPPRSSSADPPRGQAMPLGFGGIALPPRAQVRPPPPMMMSPQASLAPPPESESGGAAGMAGVGRRAFQAAAHAAMITTSMGHQHQQHPFHRIPSPMAPPAPAGMGGRRSNSPPYLTIQHVPDRATPSLSPPGSPYSSSPRSPRSPHSPISRAHSPGPHPQHHPRIVDPRRTPSPSRRTPSPAANLPPLDIPIPSNYGPRGSPGPDRNLPFFEKYKQANKPTPSPTPAAAVPQPKSAELSPQSPMSESELAYASFSTTPKSKPQPKKPLDTAVTPEKDTIAFPKASTSSSPSRSNSDASETNGPAVLRFPPARKSSASSASSSYSANSTNPPRPISKSTGALDRIRELEESGKLLGHHMETVLEEPSSTPSLNLPVASSSGSSSPLLTPPNGSPSLLQVQPKFPTRAVTSPSPSLRSNATRRRTEKTCVKCQKVIDDGRWIAIDDGTGVLCEKDWKQMYLPKCRRCDLPIESQAVSSADGQLKGKYHRQCFNCHVCHKPFPDKSFYIYSGRPYCAYHYHQSNNSLCSLPSCGKPIEGPCAEDHDGRRYHPEHLTCEGDCGGTQLEEYLDVNGKKLCERCAEEARWREEAMERVQDDDDSHGGVKAMRRRTRYLEL